MNREKSLDAMKNREEPFDVCVVGGGATGLGVAVDAAERGYSVALIEQADFAKATSSRSTKLVHGGVRYLKQGNVSLVREALRERGRIMKNAPHLAKELGFVIPIYKWFDGPFYGIGLKVYDALAGKLGIGKSAWLGKDETIAALPTIKREGLRGGVRYFDGQFDDARFAIDLARTASQQGAHVANYVRCAGLMKEGGKIVGVKARDEEAGAEWELRARVVVNATGIFADQLRKDDESGSKAMVQVSQGAHLVLPKEFLPADCALMIPKTADGRVLFAVPWKDVVIVGTTDTPQDEPQLEPRPLDEELEFILSHTEKYMGRRPERNEVRSIYAGLRPLVRKPGSGENTSQLSRDHTIVVARSGLLTVTGGKWTTYRKMAEDVVDRVSGIMGDDQRPCGTVDLAIEDQEGDASVNTFVRREMARTVEDVLARRHRTLLTDARAAKEQAPEVAKAMASLLGRDESWQREQVADFQKLATGYHMSGM
jgi:glycerol-3-phosphate dehydrogenase